MFELFYNLFKCELTVKVSVIDSIIVLRAFQFNKQVGKIQGLFLENGRVLLADIDNRKQINKGVGSALIIRFESFCKEKGAKEIYGNLAYVDLDHKDRLIHFYKKHGYSIVEENEDNSYWGKIIKQI